MKRTTYMNAKLESILNEMNQESGNNGTGLYPLLNKYYLNLDMRLLSSCVETTYYNESLLILDEKGDYSDKPYILEMNNNHLELLCEYFSGFPIHQTNRLAIKKDHLENSNYVSKFESLISDHVKPECILTFSNSIGIMISNKFKLQVYYEIENSGFYSAIVRLNNKYFPIFSIPEKSHKKNASKLIHDLTLSSSVYSFKTCYHINGILNGNKKLIIPDDVLTDQVTRKNIFQLHDMNFMSLNYLHNRQGISDIANSIQDFDIYDLLNAQHLRDYLPHNFMKTPSKNEYLVLRKKESAISLAQSFFDQRTLEIKLNVLKHALVRLYLYSRYPKESFDLDWNPELQSNNWTLNNYKESHDGFVDFMESRG